MRPRFIDAFGEVRHRISMAVISSDIRARRLMDRVSKHDGPARRSARRTVGTEVRVIARYDFGASAPIKDLLTHFSFTPEYVASEARSLLKR